MSRKINVGDLVRFMNMTGGGEVTGFRPNGIVLVKDESGFELPVFENEVVVVTPGSTIAPKPNIDATLSPATRVGQLEFSSVKEEKTVPQPEQFRIRPNNKVGEKLTIVLAYLSDDEKNPGNAPYEAYIVNDSNYDLFTVYALEDKDTQERKMIYADFVPFDSVTFIERFGPEELNERRRVAIQMIPVKRDTNYFGKDGIDAVLKLDPARFFRQHAFVQNDFFDEGAILFPLLEADVAPAQNNVNPSRLREQILSKEQQNSKKENEKKVIKTSADEELVIDLHAHEVLDTTAGMEAKDILAYQLQIVSKTLDEHKKHFGKHIIFIHGKGEGVLRREVQQLIARKYPCCTMQDASFQEYGFGATLVKVHQHPQNKQKERRRGGRR